MYSDCLRCNRFLGRNTELTQLPVGRRIAFDPTRARLWVVCKSCQQWNLVPLEERWEALEECERLVKGAEIRADGAGVGLARTAGGLELFRASGISDADIANARYGRRLENRQRLLQLIFAGLGLLAVGVGVRATISSASPMFGVYIGVAAAYWLFHIWRHPPRGWVRVVTPAGRSAIVWPWQLKGVRLEMPSEDKPPELVVPRHRADLRLRGDEAADFLAGLLPKLNGADCVDASIRRAVNVVTEAEAQGRRKVKQARRKKSRGGRQDSQTGFRPWQRLAIASSRRPLTAVIPEYRLALEMAVMEEVEQRELSRYAKSIGHGWGEEEEIAAIADNLLIPPHVHEQLAMLQRARANAASKPNR